MRLRHSCFAVNFVNFLRILFIEHFWWLLLLGVLQNISSEDFGRGASENLSKTGRLYTLKGRRVDINRNGEISRRTGEITELSLFTLNACTQKSFKRTSPSFDSVTPLSARIYKRNNNIQN